MDVYWTRGVYSFNEKNEFVWNERKVENSMVHEGPAFTYSKWAEGYPTKVEGLNFCVLLNCTDKRFCQLENRIFNLQLDGIMCEALLDPTYKFPKALKDIKKTTPKPLNLKSNAKHSRVEQIMIVVVGLLLVVFYNNYIYSLGFYTYKY